MDIVEELRQNRDSGAKRLVSEYKAGLMSLARESAQTGEPMMRALEYVFPGAGLAEVRDEFMMGDDLLVAPVLAKGGAERRVALPPGRWRDDLGAIHEGPATLVLEDVPISRLPHYERL